MYDSRLALSFFFNFFYFWRGNRCTDRQRLLLQEQLNLASVYGDNLQIVSWRAQRPLFFFSLFNKINIKQATYLHKAWDGERKHCTYIKRALKSIRCRDKVKKKEMAMVLLWMETLHSSLASAFDVQFKAVWRCSLNLVFYFFGLFSFCLNVVFFFIIIITEILTFLWHPR